jgi:hypothetical protein
MRAGESRACTPSEAQGEPVPGINDKFVTFVRTVDRGSERGRGLDVKTKGLAEPFVCSDALKPLF